MLTFTGGIRNGAGGHRYLLIYAWVDGRRVGFVEGVWDTPEAFISFFRVDEDARGRGIGTALPRRFLHAARRAKKAAVALEVRSDNTESLRACRRAGFTRVHLEDDFYGSRLRAPSGRAKLFPDYVAAA